MTLFFFFFLLYFFFFNDTATTEIYTLSLHDALPICVDELVIDMEKEALKMVEIMSGDRERSTINGAAKSEKKSKAASK